jgi:hypothetical protein
LFPTVDNVVNVNEYVVPMGVEDELNATGKEFNDDGGLEHRWAEMISTAFFTSAEVAEGEYTRLQAKKKRRRAAPAGRRGSNVRGRGRGRGRGARNVQNEKNDDTDEDSNAYSEHSEGVLDETSDSDFSEGGV